MPHPCPTPILVHYPHRHCVHQLSDSACVIFRPDGLLSAAGGQADSGTVQGDIRQVHKRPGQGWQITCNGCPFWARPLLQTPSSLHGEGSLTDAVQMHVQCRGNNVQVCAHFSHEQGDALCTILGVSLLGQTMSRIFCCTMFLIHFPCDIALLYHSELRFS